MLSEQFGSRDHFVVKHRPNWLIRDTEDAFLQAKMGFP
jgi:hypothetical protein